jgi:glycerol-3-phosphate dehydrogenase
MERNLGSLANEEFDLAIIGGGIYGACMAWEAISRGLSVVLLEKQDFGWATSSNSLKIIHGGFRYLQHADFGRMRESIRERRILMRIAPHLIHPLPVIIPTYGHGVKGKEVMSVAIGLNEVISFDRNSLEDPQKRIPTGKALSKSECLRLLPDLDQRNLTGGILFYDAQVYNSERLIIDYIKSAEKAGAKVANYAEVVAFIKKGDRVIGVRVNDTLSGNEVEIRCKTVVNTSGPWIDKVLSLATHQENLTGGQIMAKAVNLVTTKLFDTYAVGLSGQNSLNDTDSLFKKKGNFLFVAPWRGKSIIGTSYEPYKNSADNIKASEKDVQRLLEEINKTYPAAKLSSDDVSFVHVGLVPVSSADISNGTINLARHYEIHDHRKDGVDGIVSVVGVKYTTARDVAEKTINQILLNWGYSKTVSKVRVTPLYGGRIERFDDFLESEIAKQPCGLDKEQVLNLIFNYGSAYGEILEYIDEKMAKNTEQMLLKGLVSYAVNQEMAQKLSDVIMRRTELGTAGHPGRDWLELCANEMGKILGWDKNKIQKEVDEVNEIFSIAS